MKQLLFGDARLARRVEDQTGVVTVGTAIVAVSAENDGGQPSGVVDHRKVTDAANVHDEQCRC
ncbi:hypothetical protein SDC9_207502 [bioreactor metagenome]|uniref:Uncharacterized protein n=1 Tax=bioreactor metagenome TaxID=1076179 RepID=A0A645J9G0_9ZZZZ